MPAAVAAADKSQIRKVDVESQRYVLNDPRARLDRVRRSAPPVVPYAAIILRAGVTKIAQRKNKRSLSPWWRLAMRRRPLWRPHHRDAIAGCRLLLTICNTDGTSWRRPRKPPKLSHWRRKSFPEMARLRPSRERGWNVVVTKKWR
jgi:hypothetical protein